MVARKTDTVSSHEVGLFMTNQIKVVKENGIMGNLYTGCSNDTHRPGIHGLNTKTNRIYPLKVGKIVFAANIRAVNTRHY